MTPRIRFGSLRVACGLQASVLLAAPLVAQEVVSPRGAPTIDASRILLTTCKPLVVVVPGQRMGCDAMRIRCDPAPCRVSSRLEPAEVRWTSSDVSVATVDAGQVRAMAPGRSRIDVATDSARGTTIVTVVPEIGALRFERPEYMLDVGDTVSIFAWVYDANDKPVARLSFAYFDLKGPGAPIIKPPRQDPLPEEPLEVVGLLPGRMVLTAHAAQFTDSTVVVVRQR